MFRTDYGCSELFSFTPFVKKALEECERQSADFNGDDVAACNVQMTGVELLSLMNSFGAGGRELLLPADEKLNSNKAGSSTDGSGSSFAQSAAAA